MSILSFLLNFAWILCGGLWMAIGWVIAAVIMAVTIIGLPWARAALNIAAYTLLPFGQKAVSRAAYRGEEDIGTGTLGVVGNVIWLLLAGWWLALGHIITAIVLAVTIIGIPFAWAHVKLAGLALWPIGMMIVPADDAPL
jgi:uncharacterized membrane protein YccF (DUF307 family)